MAPKLRGEKLQHTDILQYTNTPSKFGLRADAVIAGWGQARGFPCWRRQQPSCSQAVQLTEKTVGNEWEPRAADGLRSCKHFI